MTLRVEPLSVQNLPDALDIEVAPHQRRFVAPVAHSLAEAYVNADTAWPRLVLDGDEAVGPEGFYLHCGFVPTGEEIHGQVVGALELT